MNLSLSADKGRPPFLPKRRDALSEILSRRGQGAGQSFDWSVAILALCEIDHRFDHLHRNRASLGDVRGDFFSAHDPFALRSHLVDQPEREPLFRGKHCARQGHAPYD